MKYSNQLGVLGPWVVMALLLSGLLFGMHIMTPPVALAQSNQEAVITNPQPATAVAGTVAVVGTAAHPAFLRYELYFKPSTASADAYIYFSGAATEIVSGQLGIWNTTDLQPGTYDLRLRVVRTDGNYAEYIVPDLQVGTTTEATAALTTTTNSTTTLVPTATPIITEPVEQTATVTATAAPTPTSETVTTPTLPTDAAQILTDRNLNVRGGPSTDFPVVATLSPGDRALVIGQNEVGDWWQIALDGAAETDSGWVLGRLVTAENVDAVPVVGGAAALPASTATPTTVAATELQSTTVTEEAVGAVAPFGAPPFTSDGPVTVTFTGDVENSDALQSFLRSLLVSMGASDTSVTVTVGVLPAELPITLTVPQTATIIGSVSRTGEWGGDQIFLSTAGSADSLLALLRRQVLDQNYSTPSQSALQGGGGEVFLSSASFITPLPLCSPDNTRAVNLTTMQVAGAPAVVSLSIVPVAPFSTSCGEDPVSTGPTMVNALPQLVPPPEAQVRGSGSGSSSSGNGEVSMNAEAEIETELTVAALADHYERQLTGRGWTRLGENRADRLSWSAWSFVDENDQEWRAAFYIVPQDENVGSYLATLRAKSRQ